MDENAKPTGIMFQPSQDEQVRGEVIAALMEIAREAKAVGDPGGAMNAYALVARFLGLRT